MARVASSIKRKMLIVLASIILPLSAWADIAEPLFLDMGGFGIYRLNKVELDILTDEHIQQAYETYVRRYFAAFMYITRNIVSIEVHQGYSPAIVNPIITEFNMLPAAERRERISKLYLDPAGLREENKRIFERVVKLVDDWDIQKGFPRIQITMPDHDPNDIRRIYLKKLGLPERRFIINTEAVNSPLMLKVLNNSSLSVVILITFLMGLVLGFGIAKVTRNAGK